MTHYMRNLDSRTGGSAYAPQGAAYLEGLGEAEDLGSFDPMSLLGLIPAIGPIIQGIAGMVGGGGSGAGSGAGSAGASAPPNPFSALLGQAGAGALGPLTGLLGALGGAGAGAGSDGKGGVDAATALLAAQAARSPATDTQTKGELQELVAKGRQEASAKQTSEEVAAAVNPELQAIKGQVEALTREQNERVRLAEVTRRRRFEELVLRRLDALAAQGAGGSGGRFY